MSANKTPPRQPFQPMQGHCSLFWDLLVIVSDHHLAGLVNVAAAQRDDQIAFPGVLLDKKVQFAEIEKIAYETEKKLLKEVSLFDV